MTKFSKAWMLAVCAAACVGGAALAAPPPTAPAEPKAQLLPTGQMLTATAAPEARYMPLKTGIGPNPAYVADGAAAIAMSPNGKEMLVLTSGYNRYNGADSKLNAEQSQQYVFVYDVGANGATARQTLAVPNAYSGVAWRADGKGFFVTGGVDDVVHVFKPGKGGYAPDGKPIALGHAAGVGLSVKPQAAGVATSPDGKRLLVANYYNESVSLIDIAARKVIAEHDLRPGVIDKTKTGVAGGEFPFAVAWRDNSHAYVSAARDREIVALDVSAAAVKVSGRIATIGEPTALLYDAKAKKLYAAEDNADRIAIIDAAADKLLGEPRVRFPDTVAKGDIGKGYNPNSLALAPNGRLLVTLGGVNAVAFLAPNGGALDVWGMVPTGWYPSAVAASADGKHIFVANRKSPPGPNPQGCAPRIAADRTQPSACGAANQYIYQLEKAGLLEFRAPKTEELLALSMQTAQNIGVMRAPEQAAGAAVMAELHKRIRHVIFIVKENRTYDNVLGDLEVGNGDPKLAILGEALTPSHHDLARNFVTLDNFYDSGEQSSTGWTWSTAARSTDLLEKTASVGYAGRGLSYEAEGTSRNMNMALAIPERRAVNPVIPDDKNLLPGTRHITSPDAEDEKGELEGQGFLWNAALRAGLSVRNYGFANDLIYDDTATSPPLTREPFKSRQAVFVAADQALESRSDPYFRGYDQKFPDYWRVKEWMREYADQEATGTVPALSLLRISHDHFGSFGQAIDGVNTVETEMADNDYALGMIVERVANSKQRDSTLIFVIEDDAQNGADHVDARRSIALVAGPYVKQKAVVSEAYTTVSVLRTIEDILGVKPLGLNDGLTPPMWKIFDLNQAQWTFKARPSAVLRKTQLPIQWSTADLGSAPALRCQLRDAAYWERVMAGQDFRTEDKLDTDRFNAALWAGLAGEGAAPPKRSGADLRANRAALLKTARLETGCMTGAKSAR